MRIGLFTDTYLPEINGVVSSVHTLEKELIKQGHEVYVITTKPDFQKAELEGNILRLPGIELKFLYGYVLTTPFHISAFNTIKSLKLDIIHAHTEFSIGIFARICSRLLSIPLVSTYHTTYEDYTHYVNFIDSKVVDNVAKALVARLSKLYGDSSVEVISPSQKTKDMLIGYDINRNIHVIPTGLDIKKFNIKNTSDTQIKEIRKSYNIKDDETLVTYIGRIAGEKSIDFVIRGFKYVKEKNIKAKLLIIGVGPKNEEENLKKLSIDLGIDDIVIFGGKKPASEVPHYYHSSDVFVSASLSETQGMTFIEALASGLPVFARHDAVLDEIVYEGKTGFYFDTEEELSEKLQKYISLSNDEKNKISLNAIKQIEPYDCEVFAKKVFKVYEQAISTYKNMYVIDEVRVKDDHVVIIVESPSGEEFKLIVTNDTYTNEGLRKEQKVSEEKIEQLKKEECAVKAYQGCINKIASRDRTRKEIYDFITNNFECDIKQVNDIVEKLEERGYIDDYRYAKNYIELMKAALQGEGKIVSGLKKKGISYDLIEDILEHNSDDELEHAIKWANKVKSSIRDTSVKMKKNNLYKKMIVQGYSNDIIAKAMEHISFVEDENCEIENLRNAAYKTKKRYQNKYKGTKLRNSIFKYLSSVGYRVEDIYVVLDEMEWNDE